MAALALTACSSDGGGQSTDENVTLNFVGPEDPKTFAPVIELFQQKNPTIKINYQAVPFNDLNTVLQNRLSAKDATLDIFTADQPRIPALAARGFLVDLSEVLPRARGTILEGSIDISTYQGKLWALPIWSSTQLLYYNKKLLSAGGVTAPATSPDARLTWEQLTTDARKAQTGGAQYGFTFDQVSRYYQVQPLPESAGGGTGLTGDDGLTPQLTSDGWIKALTFYRDLFTGGLSPRGVAPEQTPDLFADGKVAYFLGGPWWMAKFQGTGGLEFGVAAHPYFAGGSAKTPTDAWSWGINPASKHRAQAIKFLEFVSLDEAGATASVQSAPFPPVNIKAFDAYLTRLQASGKGSLDGISALLKAEMTTNAVHRPRSIGYIQFETIMNKAFEDIRNGADVRATLTAASTQFADQAARLK